MKGLCLIIGKGRLGGKARLNYVKLSLNWFFGAFKMAGHLQNIQVGLIESSISHCLIKFSEK